jgi:hypothetical protein
VAYAVGFICVVGCFAGEIFRGNLSMILIKKKSFGEFWLNVKNLCISWNIVREICLKVSQGFLKNYRSFCACER